MASIRRGYSDDFVIKNSGVGINTTEPQHNLDVVGVVKGQDLKVTGISSLTAYEGFLRADHQITENTTLTFDQGPVSSLSGEIIVGTGVTVTIDNLPDGEYGPELITNGTFDSNATGWTANNAVLTSTSNQLKVDDTANAGGWSSASQEVKTEPGAKYRWEVTIGSSTDGSFIGYNAGKYTAGNAPTKTYGEFSGGQTTAIEFIAPEKITTIVLIANNDGVSYYDNVSLKKINVAEEPRAGGSEIECLKVFNTFTPPSGGTNERPYAPKPGELYYNYDFKTIEFFDGNGWRQVDNMTRSGRVVIAGGYTIVPAAYTTMGDIQSLQVMTLGNTQYFGQLNEINTEHIGCGSEIRGILGGGYVNPARVDIMQYVTIASASNAIDFGNLSHPRNQAQAVSSSTRGIWVGGFGPTARDDIDYVEINTIGSAVDFGDLTVAKSPGGVGNSPTRGVFISGYRQPQSMDYHKTEYITIASKGNGTDFGESGIIIAGGSCGSNTRGVFGGGYQRNPAASPIKTLSYVIMASFGNTVDFGNLVNNMTYASSGGNAVRGVFTGSDGAPHTSTNIDYVSVTSLGNAQDFGDLSIKTGYAGAVSDSHGGLGGF